MDERDDRFDGVVDQVKAALDKLDLDGEAIGDQLADGLKEALRVAYAELDEATTDDKPDLRVVDGGQNPTPSPATTIDPEVNVRVVRAPVLDAGWGDLASEGRIRVDTHADGGEASWQTVFRGDAVRAYRIACRSGHLVLAVDGAEVERLGAGQSVDVEGRWVRARAVGGPSTGGYCRIG